MEYNTSTADVGHEMFKTARSSTSTAMPANALFLKLWVTSSFYHVAAQAEAARGSKYHALDNRCRVNP